MHGLTRSKAIYKSSIWLVGTSFGLILPVIAYYMGKVAQFEMPASFSFIEYFYFEKNLFVYSLTVIFVVALMYWDKAAACKTKGMKSFAIAAFVILVVIGFFLYSHIVSQSNDEYVRSDGWVYVNSIYSIFCVTYSFIIRQHLFYNSIC